MALFATAFAFLAGDLFATGIVVVVVFLVVVVSMIVVVVFISGVGVDGIAADGVDVDGFAAFFFDGVVFRVDVCILPGGSYKEGDPWEPDQNTLWTPRPGANNQRWFVNELQVIDPLDIDILDVYRIMDRSGKGKISQFLIQL